MPRRHLIIGGGTAGLNAMRTIREEEQEASDITLVSAEKPYSRMVLPYYLDRSIAESHVFTRASGEAGYFLRSPSKHSNTMIPVPAEAKNSPIIDPPRAPFGDIIP